MPKKKALDEAKAAQDAVVAEMKRINVVLDDYKEKHAHLQEEAPFSVLITHGAGVEACAESVEGVDMSETHVRYCCLTNLRRQGESHWTIATLAAHEHTDAIE